MTECAYPDPIPEEFFFHRDAACRGKDPDLWFPERGDDTRPAKAICATCPDDVNAACLEFALEHGETFGLWGGKSERQRRRIRRERAGQTGIRRGQLAAGQVRTIRQAVADGERQADVASRIGCSRQLVGNVIRGTSYKQQAI